MQRRKVEGQSQPESWKRFRQEIQRQRKKKRPFRISSLEDWESDSVQQIVRFDSMEQITVSDLASEFDLLNSNVISELKKIGVWVPSSDTPVNQDIANRIRRRLQLRTEQEQEEKIRAEKAKEKKKSTAKPRKAAKKTIRQLGKARGRPTKKAEEKPTFFSSLSSSMKPRKGQAHYRGLVDEEEPVTPDLVEVSIDDEPLIEKVEASITAEELEKVLAASAADEELVAREASLAETVAPAPPRVEIQDRAASQVPVSKQEPVTAGAEPSSTIEAEPAAADLETVDAEVASPDQKAQPTAVVEDGPPAEVTLPENVTVRELSERTGIKSKDILKQLINMGVMATNINQTLDQKTAEELCLAFEIIPHFVSFEEAVIEDDQKGERPGDLVTRAPVVTVMGHVDHGKTSLLDAIRKTRVAAGEAGGITQHIGAYHVNVTGKRVVFIDTPGHAAFTMMRARGAQVTDIVVLVVAADDGVMPQTKEAIDHARAAKVPIIVAINKIDRPEADVQRVKQQLTEFELIAEDWGGDTIMVEVSAIKETNLDLLLEMILLVADVAELEANPERAASGVVLEARLDKGRGAVATLLVQDGTLAVGDSFIAGTSLGKVRAIFDDRGNPIQKTGPSSAVEILGMQRVPLAGDPFQMIEDVTKARQIIDYRVEQEKAREQAKRTKVSLEDLYSQMQAGEIKELSVVVKADTQGSAEVLVDSLVNLSGEKVKVKAIHRGVGAISETDVVLAAASDAIIIGFNVRPEPKARSEAEKEGVDVRLHTIIYEVTKEVEQAMVGLLDPTFDEVILGRAEVRDVFRVPKFGTIAGSYVREGSVRRGVQVRLLRDNVVIYEGKIDSLRRFKEDVTEVKNDYECGISLSSYNDIKPGDVVEAYTKKEVESKLV